MPCAGDADALKALGGERSGAFPAVESATAIPHRWHTAWIPRARSSSAARSGIEARRAGPGWAHGVHGDCGARVGLAVWMG